jgi:hypothetical protein
MPEFQDDVKHKSGEATGRVIATYELRGVDYFDVRLDDEEGSILYETPAVNWITIITEADRVE